jgi:hypothetical protein
MKSEPLVGNEENAVYAVEGRSENRIQGEI